jgi:hypothetical protein
MSESLDQLAATTIAPDDPQADAQPPAEVKASAPATAVLPATDEPEAASPGKAAGLPVPVVRPSHAESATADGTAADKSALAGEAAPAIEAEAAPAPCAAASETPLNFIPFHTVPPRQRKAGPGVGDIWFRAAAVAIALGIGWIAGANTFDRTEDVRRLAGQLDATQAKLADVAKAARIGPEADLVALKTDLSTLKKSVDGLSKTLDTQRAGLGTTKASLDTARSDLDSIKTALQAAQGGPVAAKPDLAKLDRLTERVDRLEHQISALMPTGSIASTSAPPAAAGQSSAAAEKDPHALPTKVQRAAVERPKIPPNGYVLRYVHDGVAVIEDQTGLHEVFPGEVLAGVGRVEAIEQRGHRWVVVTSDGLIDSDPY